MLKIYPSATQKMMRVRLASISVEIYNSARKDPEVC